MANSDSGGCQSDEIDPLYDPDILRCGVEILFEEARNGNAAASEFLITFADKMQAWARELEASKPEMGETGQRAA